MQNFSAGALGLAFVSGIILVWLRSIAHTRNRSAAQRASSHSFWCALIAFFASQSGGLDELGIIPADGGTELTAWGMLWAAVGGPIWLGIVHLIGLNTWPKELQNVRSASLEPRSLTTPFPKKLGIFVVLLAILSLASLWFVASTSGFAATAETEYVTANGTGSASAVDGLRAGTEVLPYFLASVLAVLVITTALSLVILRRRPLAGISTQDNRVFRSIWLNRLLRTSGVLLVSSTGASISYSTTTPPIWDDGANYSSSWASSASGLVLFALTLALFFWAPPANFDVTPRKPVYVAFLRVRDHLLAVVFVATTAFVILFFIGLTSLEYQEDNADYATGSTFVFGRPSPTVMVWLLLGTLGYLTICAGFALYAHLRARQARALPRHTQWLPLWVYVVAGLTCASGSYLLLAPGGERSNNAQLASPGLTLAVIAAMLIAVVGYIWWVRRCAVPWRINPAEEIWYRQVLELRGLRVTSSALLLMPAWAYELGPVPIALGLILFCLPSMVVLTRPTASIPYYQSA